MRMRLENIRMIPISLAVAILLFGFACGEIEDDHSAPANQIPTVDGDQEDSDLPERCPDGFHWEESLNGCLPGDPPDADGDATEAEEEEPVPPWMIQCLSSWDCPIEWQCADSGTCSDPAEGHADGWFEALLSVIYGGNYNSPGLVSGRFRQSGLRLGLGVEAWMHTDPVFGEAVSIEYIDIVSDNVYQLFSLTLKRDLVSEGGSIDFADNGVRGYYHRIRFDSDGQELLEDAYFGQVLAGRIDFGFVELEHNSRMIADFSFFLGPVLDDPETYGEGGKSILKY